MDQAVLLHLVMSSSPPASGQQDLYGLLIEPLKKQILLKLLKEHCTVFHIFVQYRKTTCIPKHKSATNNYALLIQKLKTLSKSFLIQPIVYTLRKFLTVLEDQN